MPSYIVPSTGNITFQDLNRAVRKDENSSVVFPSTSTSMHSIYDLAGRSYGSSLIFPDHFRGRHRRAFVTYGTIGTMGVSIVGKGQVAAYFWTATSSPSYQFYLNNNVTVGLRNNTPMSYVIGTARATLVLQVTGGGELSVAADIINARDQGTLDLLYSFGGGQVREVAVDSISMLGGGAIGVLLTESSSASFFQNVIQNNATTPLETITLYV